EIDLGAEKEEERFGVDDDRYALVLDDFIETRGRVGIVHRVFHACAAAVLHADAQDTLAFGPRAKDRVHAHRGGIRQRHSLGFHSRHLAYLTSKTLMVSLSNHDFRD